MIFGAQFLFYMTVIGVISAKIDGWDTSPNTQYHIQTDEGPERYFRYQTISGQYRKEKRLQDGTVIGSYGWVDADGYLRLNDYVADNNGYRILRTKRLYVGPQTPINDALQSSRYVPAQAGTDVSGPSFKDASSAYPQDNSKFLVFPSSTVSPVAVYPRRRPTPPVGYYPTSTPPALATVSVEDADVAITPHYYNAAAPAAAAKSSYPASNKYYPYSKAAPLYTSVIKVRPQEYNQNSLNPFYGDKTTYSDAVAHRKSFDEGADGGNDNGASDYESANYDGISVTKNGFKYYLPRQYHEEENSGGDERVGSFGYIDPFGIRRVIYYNASPSTGFVHRKNNRYVGFNATPFDPRP